MEIDRRSLMKGLLAGGALLALGTPPWAFADSPTRKPRRCLLFLGGNNVDDLFEKGVRAACVEMGYDGLQTVKVNGGLLSDPGKMATLLEQSGGARWIAVMDDASAAVFQELARTTGGRLLSVGSHVSGSEGRPSRHVWLAASPAQGAGGLLAAQLSGARESFAITESFLNESSAANNLTGWSAPGFSSYRSAGSESMHLHCSGLSVSEACRELGLTGPEDWTSIPPHVCKLETVSRQSPHWVESVGYAVAASALGVHSIQESCSTRAFVHRTGGLDERIVSSARFVSFVMDI
ncbi:twin-arginine translocation signal domain-containing protein [Nitrospira sp. NS4]|uniref:twin-arginine translocation signal domain-containing protein n=1 Tax=Nitrospira sp. NS4 TaxID=3414498 RepID=UPI003C2E7AD9